MATRTRTTQTWRRTLKKAVKLTRSSRFATIYCFVGIAILAVTTLYWSLVGASVESSNADQVANTFLFENSKTLAGSLFPSQHTFLLKIPLFWLINLFGAAPVLFTIVTVLLSLLTVGGLAYILWRIERRPIVLGTILLALAAVLLYIPAQSYPGSLLPANMAMVTTRNIEYILFIGGLILFLKAQRFKSLFFILGAVAMALLFASDRLFVSLGFATAIISGLLFFVLRRRDFLRISIRVLIGMLAGYIGAAILLFILMRAGLHFDSSPAVGPYGLVKSPKDFVIAVVFALLGVATNFGANPGYDATTVAGVAKHIADGFLSPAGFGYVITICIAVVAIRAVILTSIRLVRIPNSRRKITLSWQNLLPVMLGSASIGALIVYIVSNHYYPADSRYLAIMLFTGFIAIASAYQKSKPKPQYLIRFGVICFVAIVFGAIFQMQNLSAQHNAMNETNRRNVIVASALKSHPVSTLLGNYWRVLPIKLNAPTIDVTPLENCTAPRKVLSSSTWQPDLNKTSFAYLLDLDGSLANYPNCTLKQITDAYGRPDSSVVIDGSRSQPKELLLFFDEGIHFLQNPSKYNTTSDTVNPIALDTMPYTTCPSATVMQFVAHEDDDILFMNPDLTHDIRAGHCIRTIYFTAGDAGSNQLYWLGRQHGAEAAYNTILGTPNLPWTERIVALDASHTITVANPRSNHNISLIFMHLPDGNPQGTGFASNHFESLRKLYTREISSVHSIEGSGETYTYGEVTSALTHLMNVYKPSILRAQSAYTGSRTPDHSDHNAVGEFTTLAYQGYTSTTPNTALTYYLGYSVHDMPANVSADDYNQKVSTFLSFGQFDPATCHSLAACNSNAVYGNYLARQYTWPY